MAKIGFDFPRNPRKTALYEVEDWYQNLLAERIGRPYESIKRSNFGEYDMAVNYLTSVFEEAKAIEKVAIFNIDHMAQIQFKGKDAVTFLDRVLPANVAEMKIGQCKYTLLLTENSTVLDDLIIMRLADENFILVINAGHDITDEERNLFADADYIVSLKKDGEDVNVKDISDKLVKIDIQGPLSYKLVTSLFGESVVKNRYKPEKNMRFFTFNEFEYEQAHYIISRTGYTNRWGWELYVPVEVAERQFKRIALGALELGGLVVGLGGRDENRISAGNFGLPLNGSEYDKFHTPSNAPLFKAAVDLNKENFIGKQALQKEIESNINKRMVLFITEGIVSHRGIYLDGKRIGTVTSSINSPNVSLEKRRFIGSKRKNVLDENGTAAIGLGWVSINPFEVDKEGKDILEKDGKAVRIKVEFFREDEEKNPKGKPVLGYISGDGVTPATAPKPLKHILNL
ncbi:MAG: aminomethyl transferase family protein [Armatimonadetes bacterium]|nr:aminomethyl transferase family protein [Armatimonadota bacterium]